MHYLSFTYCFFFFFKQKTSYDLRIRDWISDVCSSDLDHLPAIAPGIAYPLPSHLGEKPAVAVVVVVEDRLRARPPGSLYPIARDHLPAAGPAAVAIELAKGQHGPRAHRHLITAATDAMRASQTVGAGQHLQRSQPPPHTPPCRTTDRP